MKFNENFLNFFAITNKISKMEDALLQPLFKKLPTTKVESWAKDFAKDIKKRQNAQGPHIYIHVPFCKTHCLYCHCTKDMLTSPIQIAEYLVFLTRQLKSFAPIFSNIPMSSLFLGGGTPTILSNNELQLLLDLFNKNFVFAYKAMFSIETNPSGLTKSKVRILVKNGINRVSIGIQSLDDKVMLANARPQTMEQAYRSVSMLRDAGIPVINIDLMAGLPAQTEESFARSLRKVLRWKPDSIQINPFCDIDRSLYVKLNPGTDLLDIFRLRARMMLLAKQVLSSCGYAKGEYGFFHKKEAPFQRHAQQVGLTMKAESLLGFGPYAYSRLIGKGTWFSRWDKKDPSSVVYEGCQISLKYYMADYLVKKAWSGVKSTEFKNLFGQPAEHVFQKELKLLKQKNIISSDGGNIRYIGPRNIEGVYNYYTYTSIFYGKQILSQMKKKYGSAYSPEKQYSWGNDALKRKMQDTVFMMTLCDCGF